MRFLDLSIAGQVLAAIFYILAIVLEIACSIIGVLSGRAKRALPVFLCLLIISCMQFFMMIERFYEIEWKVPVTNFTRKSAEQPLAVTLLFLAVALALSTGFIARQYRKYKREISFNSIKEAFDTLPKAISIFNQKRIPVLVNKRMYDLIYLVSGKDFQGLDDIADLLRAEGAGSDLREPGKAEGTGGGRAQAQEKDAIQERDTILEAPDGSVWQFKEKTFPFDGELYLEISASEITRIYRLSEQLQEKNRELREQKERQERLLRDMIRSKKEEEVLNLKIETHSKFGKAILATQLFLASEREESPMQIWQEVLQNRVGADEARTHAGASSLKQLVDASSVFGCRILLDGELPKDEGISYLIVTAMREAITNAVRHAKADEVKIRIRSTESGTRVDIEDNSKIKVGSIKETGGLADLRKQIEKSGGSLQINCHNSVKLSIVLPPRAA
ncbi:MAG: hypothetical protein Q4A72_06670 [Bacillota bacterium]|nr:hypothetical protein [Bacillota bacterium]